MITPSDEVKMRWSANIAPCSSVISKVPQLLQLVLLSPTACGMKRRRSGRVIIYALRSDAAAVAKQVLQRAVPSFLVLHALFESHCENKLVWNLSLQATHCQRPGNFATHCLQMRSFGFLQAFSENSSFVFCVLHLRHWSCSGVTQVLQTLSFGVLQACSENSATAFCVLHLRHSRSSGFTQVLQTLSFGVLQAYSENSATDFCVLHLRHSRSSGFTQALQILPSG